MVKAPPMEVEPFRVPVLCGTSSGVHSTNIRNAERDGARSEHLAWGNGWTGSNL